MSAKNRVVTIPERLFDAWHDYTTGVTVELGSSLWPDWAKRSRNPDVDRIYFCPADIQQPEDVADDIIPGGRLTVLRQDDKDRNKGFPINKDVYIFIRTSDGVVIQSGPYSKDLQDHWMREIPDEYNGWPVRDTE